MILAKDVKIIKSNGNLTYPVSGDSSIIQGAEGDGSILFDGALDVVEFVADTWERWSGLQVAAGVAVDSVNRGSTCTSKDTDGDGTPNHLDPDSDGDGCFDSYEAGVTGSTKSGASTDSIATGSYGSNGLANSLENNDTDAAKVNYDNTYTSYALSKILNVCADTDNDSIRDLVDIDDDNDGVVDIEESPSCFYKESELQGSIKITSQFTSPDDDQKDRDIQLLHDGATTQTFNFDAFTTTQNPTGSNLFTIEYPTPVSPATIVISDNISATTSANAVVKGSNDGATWSTALSPATVITGSPVTFNLTNTTPFKYYRIETGSIAGALATANTIGEITTTFRGYGGSSHPKSVCTIDTDNDGIVNHLDLDSDGDGCFDSFEAGVTGSTKSGASTDSIATGFYGSNGLANSLENNDTDTAKVNYDSKYTSYAVSKTLNACLDADNDGIGDLVDIDDDNDGIIDSEESPSCFYKESELQGSIKITAQFTSPDDDQKDGDIQLLHDGATTQTFNFDAFTTTQNPTGSNLFTIEYPTPVTPATIVISDNISATTNANAVVKGSNDGVTWSTALSPATVITGSPVTFNLTNTTPFKYYRIETGSIAGALATANTIGEITTTFKGYGASSHPKSVCTTDTDNDGKYNHFDLDSDGDRCFDSYESGVTGATKSGASTDSIATAPYGSNGLANSLENNDTDSAKVNYKNKYTLYAVSKVLNVCADTDNDGIRDLVDIDDDNDGVPDTIECPGDLIAPTSVTASTTCCGTSVTSPIDATEAAFADGVQLTDVLPSPYDGNSPGYHFPDNAIDTNTYIFKFGANTLSGVVIWAPALNTVQYKHEDGPVRQFTITLKHTGGIYTSPVYTTEITGKAQIFSFDKAYTGVTEVKMKVLNGWVDPLPDDDVAHFPSGSSDAPDKVAHGSVYNVYIHEFRGFHPPSCDTDGDGIINRLDPDSDGDGCFDSYEAGVTGSTKSGASTDSIATGSYGSNGLANSLENNDTDTAKVNYNNKYTSYALSKTLNACLDTDNDGIGDLVDIDDDNDGIIDSEESPSCFYKESELQGSIKITSQFTSPDDDQKDGDILLLHDGATTQTFNFDAFTTTQNLTGSNLFMIEYPTSVTPATIVISDNISATTNANAVVKGSNDGVTWSTALSPATLITGSPVTFNLTNTTPFKYYRIETGSIAGALATANTIGEITTTFRGYGASSHPKSVCTTDTDNDGIVNHLDPDSDGDGCFDSYEAGVTGSTKSGASTDSIATGSYGSNGLANSLESNDTDSAKVSYNNQYSIYALSKTLNLCLDADNDGIGDLVDIDDDNDGILDRIECPENLIAPTAVTATTTCCEASSTPKTTITATEAAFADGVQLTDVLPSPYILNKAGYHYSNNGLDKNIYTYTFDSKTLSGVVVWTPGMNTEGYNHDDGPVRQFTITLKHTGGTYTSPVYTTEVSGKAQMFSFDKAYTGVTEVTMDVLNGWVDPSPDDDVAHFPSGSSDAPDKVTHSSAYNVYLHEFRGVSTPTCDTDGDGIPNGKDPDSDGDGCTDAFESGVTTLLGIASNATIAPAPYGSNGFSNSVETAAESNTYKGTYTYANATDATVANCPKTAKCSDFTNEESACTAAASDTTFGKLDCDGDGVINSKECTDGTDPNDPCKYVPTSVTLSRSAVWDTLDCDGDDVPNKTDPDPKDPCKNGYTTMQALCTAITAGADSLGKVDCDGDGVINSKECTDGTDPNDPCKYVSTSATLSRSAAWDTLDCDGDDVPNKTDPDPKDPCKNGYTTMQALCTAITAGADSLGKLDCDGDGVINSKECTDGTDPNDPCKYVPTSVTLSRSAAWDTLDCDGDDVPNKTDPDPKDPCKNGYTTTQALCTAITAGADSLGKLDCDGDGVINSKECTDGTDPNDPCKYVPTSVTLSRSAAWDTLDCDGDDVPNKTDPDPKDPCKNGYTTMQALCTAITAGADSLGKVDCDGDGVINSKECTDGTDPNDPCKYVPTSATLSRSAAWDTLDCDGDDVPNKTDPDPKDPCKNGYTTPQALCTAITAGADSLGKVDCDGDGVINSKECTDGTDPNDPCKYVPTSVTLSRSAAWDTLDCDGDDVPNKTDPDPKDPCKNGYTTTQALCTAITAGADSLGKLDCDGDGVINSKECTDGTDPNDPCKYVPTSVTLSRSAAWDTLDCDGDDVPNKTDPDPKDPCKNGYTTMQALCTAITAGADSLGKVDCDGDGVINSKECTDGTDPNDPCKYVPISVTLSRSAAWDTLDCDGDDVPNKTDPDPKDPCKNGYTTPQALCTAITAGADSLGKLDCDGDGVINSKECTDGTDPNDPCKYVPTSVTLSRSAAWDTLDCDGDDVPNKTDPDPKDPCKNGYTTTQALCTAITAGADSLGKVDCDGDGVINSKECTDGTDPNDPCKYVPTSATLSRSAAWDTLDCDGDDVPNKTDPDPKDPCKNGYTTTQALCTAITAGADSLGKVDCDGDGVINSKECTDGTEPKDPCKYVPTSVTLLRSAAWDTLDCDGDDVPNKTDPDPKDPCKNGYTTTQALCTAITAGADSLGKLDCDGDGVINSKECTDGTDPNDPCKYVPISATLSRSAAWDTLDCDGDDVPNKTDPDPKDPCKNGYTTTQALCTAITAGADSLGKVDCDGDGVINSKECTDGTEPKDPCKYVPTSVTLLRSAAWDTLDCDGDDVPNKTDPDPKDPCKNGYTTTQALCTAITAGADSLGKVDCDGDGVINSKECTDGTDPNDPCKYVPTSVTLSRSAAWDTLDCDGDDVPNKTDPDPKDPCKNGYTTMQALCTAITAGADSLGKVDCDGDGVINSKECTDGTDPNDPCKYVPTSVTLSRSAAWDTLDCDGDDVPNKTDPDPKDPCKNGYTTTQALCTAITAGADSLGKADCDGDGVINSKECTDGTEPKDPCDFNSTNITNPVTALPGNCDAILKLKVILQGALLRNSTGIMRDDLRKNKVIPSKEPYTVLGGRFQHVGGGGESLGSTALDDRGNDSVVDWVFVELRDGADSSKVVQTVSALVQRDGDVVSATDGTSSLTFSGRVGQKHFVSVRHRNHLGAMISSAITLASTGTVVDFTTMSSANAHHSSVSTPKYDGFEQTSILGVNALWAGNVDNDRKVKNSGVSNDRILIFAVMNNSTLNPGGALNTDKIFPVYMQEDVNMDAKVKYNGTGNDPSYIFTNVVSRYKLNTAANANYDFFLEQLP